MSLGRAGEKAPRTQRCSRMLSSLEMISCQRLQKIAPRECGARLERLGKAGPVRRRSVVRAISAPEKTEKKTDNGTFNAATLRKLGDSDLLVSGKQLAALSMAAVFRSGQNCFAFCNAWIDVINVMKL